MHNLIDPAGGYANILGQAILGDTHRFQELGHQYLAGVDGRKISLGHSVTLFVPTVVMVLYYSSKLLSSMDSMRRSQQAILERGDISLLRDVTGNGVEICGIPHHDAADDPVIFDDQFFVNAA